MSLTAGYPFAAVLGADDMQLALLLNAVSPEIGGVLLRGEKGTAKSTAVRALAAILPPVGVVAGCRFSCAPDAPETDCPDGPHRTITATSRPARLVELPVGASEDRVTGSLDLEKALSHGTRAFEPGLLADAHRGILYVDEVNLLADHLVDVLLDASAMGRNHVERDSVSVQHPSRFVLIGSMNPEEGELRPQLLDRFGLTVQVAASRDPKVRVEVVRRRLAADADPREFAARWAGQERELAARIVAARQRLADVELSDAALNQIAEVCAAFDVDGMRADIITARTAIAHAAWHGRARVTDEDVRVAALLALPHRRRRNPFDEPGLDTDALDEALSRSSPDDEPDPDGGGSSAPEPDPDGRGSSAPEPDPDTGGSSGPEPDPESGCGTRPDAGNSEPAEHPGEQGGEGDRETDRQAERSTSTSQVGSTSAGKAKVLRGTGRQISVAGRRAPARTGRGQSVRPLPASASTGSLHLSATVTAAAAHQHSRGRTDGPLVLHGTDVRRADRRGKEGNLVLFVVDASGSMAARTRMAEVKGAVLSLLMDAYQRRDKVGLIAFRDKTAELVLPPTSSVLNAARRLEGLRTGGRTPLAAGLAKAVQVLSGEALRDPLRRPLVVLITDGRADNAAAVRAGAGLRTHDVVVIDCERSHVRLGLARDLAGQLGAVYLQLSDVTSEPLTAIVDEWRAA